MKTLFTIATLCVSSILYAQENWTSGRPDGHAPIGVMGDHTHNKGEFMVSYRYMFMDMDGMRQGTNSVSPESLVGTMAAPGEFMVSPTKMPMNMHMIGAMYAISDRVTLMGMFNILDSEMDHITRMGGQFRTSSGGLGDTWLAGMYRLFNRDRKAAHVNLGVRIPTGSIDETDVTPASAPNETQLPYPMQVGTGTVNVRPAFTYLIQRDRNSFGAQASVEVPLNKNDRDYNWGTKTEITGWGAYKLSNQFSASIRALAIFQGEINGADPAYTSAVESSMVPTVFPSNFGGTWVYLAGGVNYYIPEGTFKNLRIGLEYELPVVQDLNGTQMEIQSRATIGVQYAF